MPDEGRIYGKNSGPGGSIGDILQCLEDPLEESSADGGYVWK